MTSLGCNQCSIILRDKLLDCLSRRHDILYVNPIILHNARCSTGFSLKFLNEQSVTITHKRDADLRLKESCTLKEFVDSSKLTKVFDVYHLDFYDYNTIYHVVRTRLRESRKSLHSFRELERKTWQLFE